MTLLVRLCVGVVSLVALTACSTDDAEPPPPTDDQSTTTQPDRRAELDRIEAYYPRLAQCLTDQGFPATWDPLEGAMQVEFGGEEQLDAAEVAEAACREDLGPAPTRVPMTEVELTGLYDRNVEAYECLLKQGYTPAEPPTRERWLADYPSGNAWEPHADPQGLNRFPEDVCPVPGIDDLAP